MLNFILWDNSPVLFSLGNISIHWYAIALIGGILIGRKILYKLNKKNPATEPIVLLAIVFAIIGGRLFYSLLNDSGLIISKPWEALLPFRIVPKFQFLGLNQMSAEGALFSVIIAVWIMRHKIPNSTFVQLLDRFCIALAVCCACLSFGLFLSGETPGKPTGSPLGTVNTYPITLGLTRISCCVMRSPGGKNPVESAGASKDISRSPRGNGESPILLYVYYQPGFSEQSAREFLIGDVKNFLFLSNKYLKERSDEPLRYSIFQQQPNVFAGRIQTVGIARHPTHFFEGVLFTVLSILLFRMNKVGNQSAGKTAGIFFVSTGLILFITGFLKVRLATYDQGSFFSVNQLVCIIFLVVGGLLLYKSFASRPNQK